VPLIEQGSIRLDRDEVSLLDGTLNQVEAVRADKHLSASHVELHRAQVLCLATDFQKEA